MSQTRQQIVTGLKNLRHNVCCYIGDQCDCKYGIQKINKMDPEKVLYRDSGEQTGCPELYFAIGILESMTDSEYNWHIESAREKQMARVREMENV